ncbi:hypothetical protein ACQB6R_03085 [Propionibacteriaceae bacterium G1746]|uniref:hypothetical protein n=1 Tax=Aestuariimicrobium sp. G57 TaxID=3418485 RepID=UPI003C1570CA
MILQKDVNDMAASIALPGWLTLPPGFSPGESLMGAGDQARAQALSAGAIHDEVLRGLEQLADENGGGVLGLVKGLLPIYERLGYITAVDATRLLSGFEAVRAALGSATGLAPLEGRLRALLEEASQDATSGPACLAVLAVLASDAAMPAPDSDARASTAHVLATLTADGLGALAGVGGGPVGAYFTSVSVSSIVEHTHVELRWH